VSVFDFQKHLMSAACDAAYFHIFWGWIGYPLTALIYATVAALFIFY
jgi:hypothetical protein